MGGLEAKVFSLKNEDSETQIVKLAIQLYFVIVLVLFQVLKALNQLHDVNVTTRTERFILSCLKQDNMQEGNQISSKSCFQSIIKFYLIHSQCVTFI